MERRKRALILFDDFKRLFDAQQEEQVANFEFTIRAKWIHTVVPGLSPTSSDSLCRILWSRDGEPFVDE